MRILVLLAHPTPGSFNHALAHVTVETLRDLGHQIVFHDLYEEGFEALLPGNEIPRDVELPGEIELHCRQLTEADGIVVVHPNWWGMPPAVLTGWVDRVVRPGVAYEFVGEDGGEGVPVGLLKADRAVVFNTGNTNKDREKAVFGDPLERIWKDCVFGLCGVEDVRREYFTIVCISDEDERQAWLERASEMIAEAFPAED